MLDEPSLGLAPLIIREIFRIIPSLRESRRFDPADRAERARGARDGGLRLRDGDRRDRPLRPGQSTLIDDPQLIATYLGGQDSGH